MKRACEYIRNKYSMGFGNGRAPIEGPEKSDLKGRPPSTRPSPQEEEEYCESWVYCTV